MLTSGQADFEVAHEADRAFRVIAGSAEVVDLGTKFDVRLEHDSTVVTVVEGRVAVGPSPMLEKLGANSNQNHAPRFVQLSADQQIRVTEGEWPATPVAVDAQRTTAWLRREIVFDHEPLERVAAEYNRYTSKPIEIATPALRNLQISGVFATDDTEAFIAFLRSLKGVRVEVTETRIRVSGGLGVACAPTPQLCRPALCLRSGHAKMPEWDAYGRSIASPISGHRDRGVRGAARALDLRRPLRSLMLRRRSPRLLNPRRSPPIFPHSLSRRRWQRSPARPACSSSMSPVSCVTRDPTRSLRDSAPMKRSLECWRAPDSSSSTSRRAASAS